MAGGQALPVLYVAGTHYDVGYNIGITFAERIKRYIQWSFLLYKMFGCLLSVRNILLSYKLS